MNIQSVLAMLLITGIGWVPGLSSIVLLPFAKLHELGRMLTKVTTLVGGVSPVLFLLDLGAELGRPARMVLMSPAVIGLLAWRLYSRWKPPVQGFEVLPLNDSGDGQDE